MHLHIQPCCWHHSRKKFFWCAEWLFLMVENGRVNPSTSFAKYFYWMQFGSHTHSENWVSLAPFYRYVMVAQRRYVTCLRSHSKWLRILLTSSSVFFSSTVHYCVAGFWSHKLTSRVLTELLVTSFLGLMGHSQTLPSLEMKERFKYKGCIVSPEIHSSQCLHRR